MNFDLMFRGGICLLFGVLWLTASVVSSQEEKEAEATPDPPMPPAERAAMLKHYREMDETLTAQIAKSDTAVGLYSRRGDCKMFLADFEGSERDYAKMIELDKDLFSQHWRLGIAYFYTGKFEESAKQFEAFDTYNDRDRENGLWQFMARVKVGGIEDARTKMLKYEVFDREPFPQLYAMFEGKDASGGDAILKEIRKAGIGKSERERRLFFANLYIGIFKDLTGKTDEALTLLRDAAASKWGQTASGGPGYMWQVARLHYERLLADASRSEREQNLDTEI